MYARMSNDFKEDVTSTGMSVDVPRSKGSIARWVAPESGFEPIKAIVFIGTLGLATGPCLSDRLGTSNLPFRVNEIRPGPVLNTPAENLSEVRDVFHPSITELANLFRVSRQAVYDWQAGKGISSEHADKLESLAKAASVIRESGLTVFQPLRRKLAGGKTLFETVRDGGSPESAALALVRMAKRDVEQRQQLDARLSGRRRPINYDDIGITSLSEEA